MLLVIDNYDSFTYNIVQYLEALNASVKVIKNDVVDIKDVQQLNPQGILLSPGPCTPNEAGISLSVVEHFAGRIPLLGVCLGHQVIAQWFGGKVVAAKRLIHGKTVTVYHNSEGVFSSIPDTFKATRYNSLSVDGNSLPDCLQATAWTQDSHGKCEDIMGLRHRELEIEGVQFHPESILSEYGYELLGNFVRQCKSR